MTGVPVPAEDTLVVTCLYFLEAGLAVPTTDLQ